MEENPIVSKLLEKAKEAFVVAIEIYNKPTIRYRVEGFSFFICNAWELMLKAYMIKTYGLDSIYYKDSPSRTLSLEVCIRRIFTNENSPVRLNLEKIVELRNTSTHFIVEEYEMVYIPLFQACIFNFIEKMEQYHQVDMTTVIPQNFLTLAVSMKALNEAEVRAKYPGQIAERLVQTAGQINPLIEQNNSAFAIRVDHYHYITKKPEKATEVVRIDRTADAAVQIIKELQDPNDVFKYSAKKLVSEINHRLKRQNITLRFNGEEKSFTTSDLQLFLKYYKIKDNPKLCYTYKTTSAPLFSYSAATIEFIVEEIRKDPDNIIRVLRKKQKKS